MQTAIRSAGGVKAAKGAKSPHRRADRRVSTTSPALRAGRDTALRAVSLDVEPPAAVEETRPVTVEQLYGGLQGHALDVGINYDYPPMGEVLRAIPKHCFAKDTQKSMMYAVVSTLITVGLGVAAWATIPLKLAYWPAWVAYAMVTGTAATGAWVVAHECGHGAFSDNKRIQDTVGYILHSALLVPYFSWQRSHAVHHSKTNHIDEGETHVPMKARDEDGAFTESLKEVLGEGIFGVVNLALVLLFGWPMYLIVGASGGPVRGQTSHFNPWAGEQGKHALFPGKWKDKVLKSDVGVFVTVAALGLAAAKAGFAAVAALYVGPYLFCNAWLVLYTWLQHTDVDVPHFGVAVSLVKGSFMTIDRPYGPTLDFLHHRIGSTHVAHHINHTIPHYHAVEATEALKTNFPDLYLYDPTPVHEATWRIASKCTAVRQREDGMWAYSGGVVEPAAAAA